MSAICFSEFLSTDVFFSVASSSIHPKSPKILSWETSFPRKSGRFPRKFPTLSCSNSTEAEELALPDKDWLMKLPEKKKPLYCHSLPCIEAWLRSLGFCQSKDDRAVWLIDCSDWHVQLSLDVTDLRIRLVKKGPENIKMDVETRFSYMLSREEIKNAELGGP